MAMRAVQELTEKQQAYVDGLHELAAFLAERPDLIPEWAYEQVTVFAEGSDDDEIKADFARLVRMVGSGEKQSNGVWFNFVRKFGPHEFHVTARHEQVCERVVVGVDVVEVPDPAAVAALPKVATEVERVEWVCPPSVLGLGRG